MTIKLKQDLNNIITPLINKLNCITGEKYIGSRISGAKSDGIEDSLSGSTSYS